MVTLVICYPASAGTFFNVDYYRDVHMPMSERLLGEFGLQGYTISRGTGTVQGDEPPMLCVTELRFETLAGLRDGLATHGAALREDFSNYTDIQPVATVCEPLN